MAAGRGTSAFRRSARRTSTRGLALIGEFEGTFLRPYNDPVGHATVGIGHLIHFGNVTEADRRAIWVKGQKVPGQLTVKEAWKLLKQDLGKSGSYEAAVRALTRRGVALTQPQFDALVSFVYNCGPGSIGMAPASGGAFRWDPDETTVSRALYARTKFRGKNARRSLVDAGEGMKLWNKAGGRVFAGLVRRRNAEVRMLLS